MKDITMNKIIHTFQIILLLGLIAAQPLNAQLRIPASPILKNNGENEGSYHVRFQQIKNCRDWAQYFLSQPPNSGGKHLGSNYKRYAIHNRGPQIPSKQNCVNALWYLRRASDLGDFESAQILGDVYSTGRLLGHHAIQAFPDEAAKYRVRVWSIAKNSGVVGWKNRELPLAEQQVAVLAKNGNLHARKSFSVHLVAKGDRLSRFDLNHPDAMDAYFEAASLNPNDVQLIAKMEQILPHAMQLAFGSIRHQIKPWHIAGTQNPRVMQEAAKLARRQGDSLRAIDLAEAAHRNLAPNAQAPTERFIASIRMDLASDAELNRDYQLAIFHAKQAGKFNDPQAEGYIENMEFKEVEDLLAKQEFDRATAKIARLQVSTNPAMRRQADALSKKMPDNFKPQDGAVVFRKISPSTFEIRCNNGSKGTGFVVADGIIASNIHVIKGATRGTATQISSQKQFTIQFPPLAQDARRDLVILRVNFNGPSPRPLPIRPIDSVEEGENVFALGNPYELFGNFSKGMVSALPKYDPRNRMLKIGRPGDTIIATDTAVNPGNSGGPLVDNRGNVIGVITYGRPDLLQPNGAIKKSEGLNFAIAAEHIRALLP
jgi:S1-C subfamily serine protease